MKKISLFLAFALLVSMAFAGNANLNVKNSLSYGLEMLMAKQQANEARTLNPTAATTDDEAMFASKVEQIVYGYCIFDNSWKENKSGIYSLDPSSPKTLTLVKSDTRGVVSGAYYDGYYYVQVAVLDASQQKYASIDFYKIEFATGQATHIKDWMGEDGGFFYDMTYDYSTKTLYGVAQTSETGSILCSINIETGVIATKQTAEIPGVFITLACNNDGVFYAVDNQGNLCTLNTTGNKTTVGKTGKTPTYIQSMEFNRTDGTLYWAMNDKSSGLFGTIDIESGKFTSNGVMGDNAEIVALYIPSEAPVSEEFVVTIETPKNGTLAVKNGTTTVTSGDKVKSGTTLTITAKANEGFELDKIMVNGKAITGTTCKVTAATTISATFKTVIGVNNTDAIKFNIYPNPTRDIMNIEGDFTSISVYNSVGQCVGTYSAETTQINVSNLSEGVYVVRVYSGDVFSTRKVVIKK